MTRVPVARGLMASTLTWLVAQGCAAADGTAYEENNPNGSADSVEQVTQALCPIGPAFPSCYGECGHLACSPAYPDICCACDEGCEDRGDCCCDYLDYCPPQPTCVGHCGGLGSDGSCFCDDLCLGFGDCCDDFEPVCWGWPIVFGSSTASDSGKAVAIDSSRNVYVAAKLGAPYNFGFGAGATGQDRARVSFNNLAAPRWSTFSTGLPDTYSSLAVDPNGQPWFTVGHGTSSAAFGSVVQLNPSSGATLREFSSFNAYTDIAAASTAVTAVGGTYVAFNTVAPRLLNIPYSGSATLRGGPDSNSIYRAVVVDSSGNVYVVVEGAMSLTTGITKLTPTAARVWLRDTRPLRVRDITLDGTSTLAAGACEGFSACTGTFAHPAGSAVLFKLDGSGNVVWQTSFDPPSGSATFIRIFRDSFGRVHVLGHTSGPLTFGSTTIGATGSQTGFIASFNTSGTFLDVDVFCQAVSSSSCTPEDMAVAPNVARYVTGAFSGTAVISGSSFSSGSGPQGFVAHVPL